MSPLALVSLLALVTPHSQVLELFIIHSSAGYFSSSGGFSCSSFGLGYSFFFTEQSFPKSVLKIRFMYSESGDSESWLLQKLSIRLSNAT